MLVTTQKQSPRPGVGDMIKPALKLRITGSFSSESESADKKDDCSNGHERVVVKPELTKVALRVMSLSVGWDK